MTSPLTEIIQNTLEFMLGDDPNLVKQALAPDLLEMELKYFVIRNKQAVPVKELTIGECLTACSWKNKRVNCTGKPIAWRSLWYCKRPRTRLFLGTNSEPPRSGFRQRSASSRAHTPMHCVAVFLDRSDGITCSSPDLIQQTVFDQVGLSCPLFANKRLYVKYNF